MPKCARNGCGKEYQEQENNETSCHYHSGGPIFHEGLKSWSCCQDINRPVLDFESFVAIPGCTEGPHTEQKPKAPQPTSGGHATVPSVQKPADSQSGPDVNGKETFTTTMPSATIMNPPTQPSKPAPPPPEEEDDQSTSVPEGTKCKRRGCNATFVSDEVSRGEGKESTCTYHPSPPIFHEGSKGYLCCKRRVLEFDEFLKIEGCKKGKHVFAVKQSATPPAEELVSCRIDHYQTPGTVHVSVFAKQTNKEASKVTFEQDKIHLDIIMPSNKRFQRTLDLYGPIQPDESKFTFFGTKVELTLSKADTRSWLLLEKTDQPTGGYSLTFGVGGRTGTIGGKELVLSEENKLKES